MTFLPSLPVLFGFTLASVLLVLTPGPDMTLFLSKTLSGGRRDGVAAMLGASTGLIGHALLAAFGLSALLAASAPAFAALKIVGAGYLLWLAYGAIRHGSALNVRAGAARTPPWRTFVTGIGINLTNPKVVIFFVTFLPQFVDAADPHAAGKILFLGLLFQIVQLPMSLGIIWAAERFVSALKRRPRLMRGVAYGFAALMGGFAARLIVTQGR